MKRLALFAVVVFAVLLGGTIMFSNQNASAPKPLPRSPLGTVTIATTEAGTVNVWDNYQTRAQVVARLDPGTTVQLLRRDGNGRLIRTAAGVEGWVSRDFLNGE